MPHHWRSGRSLHWQALVSWSAPSSDPQLVPRWAEMSDSINVLFILILRDLFCVTTNAVLLQYDLGLQIHCLEFNMSVYSARNYWCFFWSPLPCSLLFVTPCLNWVTTIAVLIYACLVLDWKLHESSDKAWPLPFRNQDVIYMHDFFYLSKPSSKTTTSLKTAVLSSSSLSRWWSSARPRNIISVWILKRSFPLETPKEPCF